MDMDTSDEDEDAARLTTRVIDDESQTIVDEDE